MVVLPDLAMFMTKIGRGRWVGMILGPLGYSPRRDLENMLPASSSSHVMDLDIFFIVADNNIAVSAIAVFCCCFYFGFGFDFIFF